MKVLYFQLTLYFCIVQLCLTLCNFWFLDPFCCYTICAILPISCFEILSFLSYFLSYPCCTQCVSGDRSLFKAITNSSVNGNAESSHTQVGRSWTFHHWCPCGLLSSHWSRLYYHNCVSLPNIWTVLNLILFLQSCLLVMVLRFW